MKVIVAKTAGFCMGVRRAVEMALDAPAKYHGPIYTYGPLIHNPQVLELFAEKGVRVLNQIPEQGTGTVLVRAHGVPPESIVKLKTAGFRVINATCPRVVKVQSIIKNYARTGHAIIIVGDNDHPEVVGLLGHAGQQGHVVASLETIKELPVFESAIIVAQTTQNQREYQQIKRWISECRPAYKVFDTICDSTEKRQAEVRAIADQADVVLVVGGKESGNTQRLASIVQAVGKSAHHIETEAELDLDTLADVNHLGITAGASTPNWIIKRVMRSVEQIPLTRHRGLLSLWLKLIRLLLLSNLYVALGAGCLCYATMKLQGLSIGYSSLAVAVLYVMSMHILNHLTGRAESKYNDPDRERFYTRYKVPLISMAIMAGTLGLVAAFQMGPVPFWALLSMSILGLSYNLRIVPCELVPKLVFCRIRDVPGSKTILIALAWGVVTAGLPAMTAEQSRFLTAFLAIIWATGIVFCRTAFFDILDMQGDRIVGKETLPILLGQKRSFSLLKRVLAVVILILPLAAVLRIMTAQAFILVVPPLLLLAMVVAHEKGNMLPGIRMEFRVESLFVFSGVLAFLSAVLFQF